MKHLRNALIILLAVALLCASALAEETLKRGDHSPLVAALQYRLNEIGYSVGTADGDFGGKTEKAIRAFQKDRGLEETGKVDDATWDALYIESITVKRDGFAYEVKLTPPFYTIERTSDNGGAIVMDMGGVNATLVLVQATPLEDAVETISDLFMDSYNNIDSSLTPTGNDISPAYFEVNGTQAALVRHTVEYKDGKQSMVHRAWLAVLPADEERMIRLEIGLNYNASDSFFFEELFNDELIEKVFSRVHIGSGESASLSTSTSAKPAANGLNYEPVDGLNISDMIPYILDYVDPTVDSDDGLTDAARVNIYYGAQVMYWFERMVDAGNARNDVITEAALEATTAFIYDDDLKSRLPEFNEKYQAMLLDLGIFSEDEINAALTDFGLPGITWELDDVAEIYNRTMITHERLMNQ